jgi:hypothetical protein
MKNPTDNPLATVTRKLRRFTLVNPGAGVEFSSGVTGDPEGILSVVMEILWK